MNIDKKLDELYKTVYGLYKIVQEDYFGLDKVSRDCAVTGIVNNQKVNMKFYIIIDDLTQNGKNIIEPILHTLITEKRKVCQELFNVYKHIIEKDNIEMPPSLSISIKTMNSVFYSGIDIEFKFITNTRIYYVLALSKSISTSTISFEIGNRETGFAISNGKKYLSPESSINGREFVEWIKERLLEDGVREVDKNMLRMYEIFVDNIEKFMDIILDLFNQLSRTIVMYRLYP